MRSLISRLALAGIVGIALAGCGTSGSSLPNGGLQGTSGGGPVNGTPGTSPLPSCSLPTFFLDNGSIFNNTGTGAAWLPQLTTGLTLTQGLTNPPANDVPAEGYPVPACAPANQPLPSSNGGVFGFDDMFVNGSGTSQVILKYGGTMPNLTYHSGYQGVSYYYNYTAIVLHLNWPSVASLAIPGSVAIELVGNGVNAGAGALATTYDVRFNCTIYNSPAGPAGTLATYPAWSTLICPLTGGPTNYGKAVASPALNAIAPGAAGTFTPILPAMYLVFNYGKSTTQTSQANPNLAYMYAYQ
jgi:hypothetical protein